MIAKRYGWRKFWSSQKVGENGRWPMPGIDVYVTITEELTVEEFSEKWAEAYTEIRRLVMKDAGGGNDQPADHR